MSKQGKSIWGQSIILEPNFLLIAAEYYSAIDK